MTFKVCWFKWDADQRVMRLNPRFSKIAAQQFEDGSDYPMEVREERSSKQHAFYFASVNEAWKNLRGETAEHLNTPKHLRGWALVEAGWYVQHIVEAPSKQAAIRMAMFARALAKNEGYVEIKVVNVDGTWFVRSREPKSQSRAAMNKEDFQQSSRDVLDIISGTIEVTRRELEKAGREA